MIYHTKLLSALSNVYSDREPVGARFEGAEIFKNEAVSFVAALCPEAVSALGGEAATVEVLIKVDSPLEKYITVSTIENVPAKTVNPVCDEWVEQKGLGFYPDRLHSVEKGRFTASVGYWSGLFVNVNPELCDIPAGEYPIKIELYKYGLDWRGVRTQDALICEFETKITVLAVSLPRQRRITTNWVHYDCISVLSGTKPWTERYFKVVGNYLHLAATNGQNMVLTPAFTPALDTPVNEERMTVQLVGVELNNNKYSFDFTMLDRFINTAIDAGIEYFEHCHLFTQWGAANAPKIMVRENGRIKRKFGWHTDSMSEEYHIFLHEYLKSLKAYLKEKGVKDKFFFHVSDEPSVKWIKTYENAAKFLHGEIGDMPSGDALSDYAFYERGLVDTPIVATDHIEKFIGRADKLWAYYTGWQSKNHLTNRLAGMPQARGRILGVQMYYYGIDGFLHWGFNAHHNRLSRRIIDPRISGDMGGDFPCGTSYLVYPNGEGAEPSQRLITFRDAMQDIREFELLESLAGRQTVIDIIKKHIPDISFNCKVTDAQLLALHTNIVKEIKKHI